jgi:hypothetical protein
VASPYLWAGTDQYRSGKYVRDGVYDPNVIDSQAGCAGLLMAMMSLDPAIAFSAAPPEPTASNEPAVSAAKEPVSRPSIKNPARGSVGAWVSMLFALFKWKGK